VNGGKGSAELLRFSNDLLKNWPRFGKFLKGYNACIFERWKNKNKLHFMPEGLVGI